MNSFRFAWSLIRMTSHSLRDWRLITYWAKNGSLPVFEVVANHLCLYSFLSLASLYTIIIESITESI